jgi:hypothetical protein
MSLNGFSQEKSQLRFNSLGLKIGWYNPSLDYWKNESEFKNADFNGGFCYNVFGDLSIIKNALGNGTWVFGNPASKIIFRDLASPLGL